VKLKLFIKKQSKLPVKDEVLAIWQMLLPAESFRAFCRNNEVFDMRKQKRLRNRKKLFNMYSGGAGNAGFVFIINKN
jgi:hypothetical protein